MAKSKIVTTPPLSGGVDPLKDFEWRFPCTIIRVIDGDTVEVQPKIGFGVMFEKIRIRLQDINAPETRTRDKEEKKRGLASKAYLQELLPVGLKCVYRSMKFNPDKTFNRYLGDITTNDFDSIRTAMVSAGHAVIVK